MEQQDKLTILYRYELDLSDAFAYRALVLREHKILSETAKGYWIERYFWSSNAKRFVLKLGRDGRKRFAYPTKEQALQSYIIRTKKRISYLERDIHDTKAGLEQAKELQEKETKGK